MSDWRKAVFAIMKLHCLVLGLALVATCFGEEPKSYNGYKTYRVVAPGATELSFLQAMSKESVYDFWSMPRAVGQGIDIMVGPEHQQEFEDSLKKYNVPANVIIENYQDVIEREDREMREAEAKRLPGSKITFTQYYRYDAIVDYITQLEKDYPSLVKVSTIGTTYEGRDIKAITISSGGNGTKNAVMIEGGIHAREWIAPAVILYLINQLVENNAANKDLVDNLDWLLVPVTNPDGYEYTNTNDRMWRKNRAPGNLLCKGTDANRNFGFKWGGEGASTSPCDETFRGPSAFSEMESSAIRDYGLKNAGRVKVYLAMHSYGPYFLYPWGYQWDLPDDWRNLDALAQDAAAAIRAASTSGTRYEIGSSTQLLYAAAGGSDDYMKGGQGVAYSYTVELPGGGSQGFNPPPSSIQGFVTETFAGLKVVGRKAATL